MLKHSSLVSLTTSTHLPQKTALLDLPVEILQMIMNYLPDTAIAYYHFLRIHPSLWHKREQYLKCLKLLSEEERAQCLHKREELYATEPRKGRYANYISNEVCTRKQLSPHQFPNLKTLRDAVAVGNLPLVKWFLKEGEFGKRNEASNKLALDSKLLAALVKSAFAASDNEAMVSYLLDLSYSCQGEVAFKSKNYFIESLEKGYRKVAKKLIEQWQMSPLKDNTLLSSDLFSTLGMGCKAKEVWKIFSRLHNKYDISHCKRGLTKIDINLAYIGVLQFLLERLKILGGRLSQTVGIKVLTYAIAVADIESIRLLTEYYCITPNKAIFKMIARIGCRYHRYVPRPSEFRNKLILNYFLKNYENLIRENTVYRQYSMEAAARLGLIEVIETWLAIYPIEAAIYYLPIMQTATEYGQLAIIRLLYEKMAIPDEILRGLMITGVMKEQWVIVNYLLKKVKHILWDMNSLITLASKTGQFIFLEETFSENLRLNVIPVDINKFLGEIIQGNNTTVQEFSEKELFAVIKRQKTGRVNTLVEIKPKLIPSQAILKSVCEYLKNFSNDMAGPHIKLLMAIVKFTLSLLNQYQVYHPQEAIVLQQWIKDYVQELANRGYVQPVFELFIKQSYTHLTLDADRAKNLTRTVLENAVIIRKRMQGSEILSCGVVYKNFSERPVLDVCDMSYQLLSQYQLGSEKIGSLMLHAFAHEGRLDLVMDLIKQRKKYNKNYLVEDQKLVNEYFPSETLENSARQLSQAFFSNNWVPPQPRLSAYLLN